MIKYSVVCLFMTLPLLTTLGIIQRTDRLELEEHEAGDKLHCGRVSSKMQHFFNLYQQEDTSFRCPLHYPLRTCELNASTDQC